MINLFSLAVGIIDPTNIPHTTPADKTTLNKGLLTTYVVVGAIAVMLIVIAGFRYVISEGDPSRVADARRSIIYTGVGLVVTASAATIIAALIGAFH